MDISKSSRHSKLTGNFGEALILYWLSKYGFECALIDHIGIDLIARNPHTNEIMGISVKTRSRIKGKESTYVRIPNNNFAKAKSACKSFGCIPYFAIVIDAVEIIKTFLLPMDHFLKIAPMKKKDAFFKLTQASINQYCSDPKIKIFELAARTVSWW